MAIQQDRLRDEVRNLVETVYESVIKVRRALILDPVFMASAPPGPSTMLSAVRLRILNNVRTAAAPLSDFLDALIVGTAREQTPPFLEALNFRSAVDRLIGAAVLGESVVEDVRSAYRAFLNAAQVQPGSLLASPTSSKQRMDPEIGRNMGRDWIYAHHHDKPWRKDKALEACRKECGSISGRAFNEAWRDAAPPAWKQPGPKKS